MLELNQVLTDPGILNNWCAIIVIQELITLIAGFSLLADRAEDTLSAKTGTDIMSVTNCCKQSVLT